MERSHRVGGHGEREDRVAVDQVSQGTEHEEPGHCASASRPPQADAQDRHRQGERGQITGLRLSNPGLGVAIQVRHEEAGCRADAREERGGPGEPGGCIAARWDQLSVHAPISHAKSAAREGPWARIRVTFRPPPPTQSVTPPDRALSEQPIHSHQQARRCSCLVHVDWGGYPRCPGTMDARSSSLEVDHEATQFQSPVALGPRAVGWPSRRSGSEAGDSSVRCALVPLAMGRARAVRRGG